MFDDLIVDGRSIAMMGIVENKASAGDSKKPWNEKIRGKEAILLIEKKIRGLIKKGDWKGLKRGELKSGLRQEDEDDRGYLKEREFAKVIRKLSIPLIDDEINTIASHFNTEKNSERKKISIEDFLLYFENWSLNLKEEDHDIDFDKERNNNRVSSSRNINNKPIKSPLRSKSSQDSSADLNSIKKRLISVMESKTVSEREIRDKFQNVDIKDKGYISRGDFKRVMNQIKIPLKDSELAKIMNSYSTGDKRDLDDDFNVDYLQVIKLFSSWGVVSDKKGKENFTIDKKRKDHFDDEEEDRDDKEVDVNKIKRKVEKLIEGGKYDGVDENKMDKLFKDHDKDRNGTVSNSEFKKVMISLQIPITSAEVSILLKHCGDRKDRVAIKKFAKIASDGWFKVSKLSSTSSRLKKIDRSPSPSSRKRDTNKDDDTARKSKYSSPISKKDETSTIISNMRKEAKKNSQKYQEIIKVVQNRFDIEKTNQINSKSFKDMLIRLKWSIKSDTYDILISSKKYQNKGDSKMLNYVKLIKDVMEEDGYDSDKRSDDSDIDTSGISMKGIQKKLTDLLENGYWDGIEKSTVNKKLKVYVSEKERDRETLSKDTMHDIIDDLKFPLNKSEIKHIKKHFEPKLSKKVDAIELQEFLEKFEPEVEDNKRKKKKKKKYDSESESDRESHSKRHNGGKSKNDGNDSDERRSDHVSKKSIIKRLQAEIDDSFWRGLKESKVETELDRVNKDGKSYITSSKFKSLCEDLELPLKPKEIKELPNLLKHKSGEEDHDRHIYREDSGVINVDIKLIKDFFGNFYPDSKRKASHESDDDDSISSEDESQKLEKRVESINKRMCNLLHNKLWGGVDYEKLRRLFLKFDVDLTERINQKDFSRIFLQLSFPLKKKEVEDLIAWLDPKNTLKVDYKKFLEYAIPWTLEVEDKLELTVAGRELSRMRSENIQLKKDLSTLDLNFFREVADLERDYDSVTMFSKQLKEDILELSEKLEIDPLILGLEESFAVQTYSENIPSRKLMEALELITHRTAAAQDASQALAPSLLIKGHEEARLALQRLQVDLDSADLSACGVLSKDRFEYVLSLSDLSLTRDEIKHISKRAVSKRHGHILLYEKEINEDAHLVYYKDIQEELYNIIIENYK